MASGDGFCLRWKDIERGFTDSNLAKPPRARVIYIPSSLFLFLFLPCRVTCVAGRVHRQIRHRRPTAPRLTSTRARSGGDARLVLHFDLAQPNCPSIYLGCFLDAEKVLSAAVQRSASQSVLASRLQALRPPNGRALEWACARFTGNDLAF